MLARNYPPYSQSIPDVVRAQIFTRDLAEWTARGTMPNLVILQLPSDHTRGATPDYSTPKAMVADNDLALGQIVEALSKSPFWPKMAILVVEDDAQNGVDHVDGHRTVALAISPYIRRGAVDSTFYAHQSMVKTIELMLGLPTLSLFDLIATDMRASFTTTPDVTPYTAVKPKQSLFERNPRLSCHAWTSPPRRAGNDQDAIRRAGRGADRSLEPNRLGPGSRMDAAVSPGASGRLLALRGGPRGCRARANQRCSRNGSSDAAIDQPPIATAESHSRLGVVSHSC